MVCVSLNGQKGKVRARYVIRVRLRKAYASVKRPRARVGEDTHDDDSARARVHVGVKKITEVYFVNQHLCAVRRELFVCRDGTGNVAVAVAVVVALLPCAGSFD